MAWKYLNYGDFSLLDAPGEQYTVNFTNNFNVSRNGTAFSNYDSTSAGQYPIRIPDGIKEIWMKCSIFCAYGSTSGAFVLFCGGTTLGTSKLCGFKLDTLNSRLYVILNAGSSSTKIVAQLDNVLMRLTDFYIHIKSGVADGVFEIYVNGKLIYSYTGAILSGEDLKLQKLSGVSSLSTSAAYYTAFSDLIVSDHSIEFDEHVSLLPMLATESAGWNNDNGVFSTDATDRELVQKIDVETLKKNVGLDSFSIKSLTIQPVNVSTNDTLEVNKIEFQARINADTASVDSYTLTDTAVVKTLTTVMHKNPITNASWNTVDLSNVALIIKTAKA